MVWCTARPVLRHRQALAFPQVNCNFWLNVRAFGALLTPECTSLLKLTAVQDVEEPLLDPPLPRLPGVRRIHKFRAVRAAPLLTAEYLVLRRLPA